MDMWQNKRTGVYAAPQEQFR